MVQTTSPHTCGGYSVAPFQTPFMPFFAPHMWGVTPESSEGKQIELASPHTCGGYSETQVDITNNRSFAPHMWGLLLKKRRNKWQHYLRPTHVGVTLSSIDCVFCANSSPHTCGGYSEAINKIRGGTDFAPHMWGLL